MKVPISWLRDFVDIDLSPEALAYKLTFGGLEVEEIEYRGVMPRAGLAGKAKGLGWDPAKIVVAQVLEVSPHPNADRLTLLRLDDGSGQEQSVLTGAPNLFPYKGAGPLPKPLKVAYAREGSVLYDGHKPGHELMTLKRAKIRGVESYSMVCSEKELGLSEEHEGILLLDDDAPVGQPLADYMGDVVLTVKINPNMARNASILGIAREVAALTGRPLRQPSYTVQAEGAPIAGQVSVEIRVPPLNPRFTAALIRGVQIGPSPYWVQRRLRLMGTRPINNIVDATNYVMYEVGQPLHAYDYDVLAQRAGGQPPTLLTRLPEPGETLTTLDGTERPLNDFTILVADRVGALGLGGVMGGATSEVSDQTVNVLLEGAAWEYINIRQTVKAQSLPSEAAYRFSRGVHPGMTVRGVQRGIEAMRQWAGGAVAAGLVDEYPLPAKAVVVDLTTLDVERLLGLPLPTEEITRILEALEFRVEAGRYAWKLEAGLEPSFQAPTASLLPPTASLRITAPDHRLDIGEGVVGRADLIEEIARVYGYERIPETRMADSLPPQRGNPALEQEERTRDLLVEAGLQEVITYSLTHPDRERRLLPRAAPPDDRPYVTLVNPIVTDRVVMRHSLLGSVLDIVSTNSRLRDRLALFEIGNVYLPGEHENGLPDEHRRVVVALTGPRDPRAWQGSDRGLMDFFDLKGAVELLVAGLHLDGASYAPPEPEAQHPSLLPGRTARLLLDGQHAGWLGELHPTVRERFDLPAQPVLVADLDLELLLARVNERYNVAPAPAFPPVKEDLAVIVDEGVPAARAQAVIEGAGGKLLAGLTLFDVYRGAQVGVGKKSLAYGLTYQAPDRTLTDAEVAKARARIVKRLQEELGATLRG